MTVDYGNNPNNPHWVREDPLAQEKLHNELGQLSLSLSLPDSQGIDFDTPKRNPNAISDKEYGGISQRERLGVRIDEKGKPIRIDYPWYMDEEEGSEFNKLSNLSYWRGLGTSNEKGYVLSPRAVNKTWDTVVNKITRYQNTLEQALASDDKEEAEQAQRMLDAWIGVAEKIQNDRMLRSTIQGE